MRDGVEEELDQCARETRIIEDAYSHRLPDSHTNQDPTDCVCHWLELESDVKQTNGGLELGRLHLNVLSLQPGDEILHSCTVQHVAVLDTEICKPLLRDKCVFAEIFVCKVLRRIKLDLVRYQQCP